MIPMDRYILLDATTSSPAEIVFSQDNPRQTFSDRIGLVDQTAVDQPFR